MILETNHVNMFSLTTPGSFVYSEGTHPTIVNAWTGGYLALPEDASHYIMVYSGRAFIGHRGEMKAVEEGCYGVFPGRAELTGEGVALVVSCSGYRALAMQGGPVEDTGRLRYIDRCTNTVLLPPPVRGEPCLNFLHLGAGVTQTPHTHPTIRIGIVLKGNGACGTAHGTLPMTVGSLFVIPPETLHSFQASNESMKIIIFHPDSVDGPSHASNTMLNNTFIDGTTAQGASHLRTQER